MEKFTFSPLVYLKPEQFYANINTKKNDSLDKDSVYYLSVCSVQGYSFPVYEKLIINKSDLDVAAGTNGLFEGISEDGKGCYTYIRINDLTASNIKINKIAGYDEQGLEICLAGDSKLKNFINALEFITSVLKSQLN